MKLLLLRSEGDWCPRVFRANRHKKPTKETWFLRNKVETTWQPYDKTLTLLDYPWDLVEEQFRVFLKEKSQSTLIINKDARYGFFPADTNNQ